MHKKHILALMILSLSIYFSSQITSFTFATDYSISMTTSGSVTLSSPGGVSAISSSEINVITNCQAGYNLTLATSVANNNLYLNGVENNSVAHFTPSDGTTMLSQASNTWGYLLTSTVPTGNNTFLPVPASTATPAILKSTQDTASDANIDDTFQVYYGAMPSNDLASGTYYLVNDTNTGAAGTLAYQLTASPSCVISLDLSFNQNLDGAGDETDDGTNVANFPTSADNTIDTINNTITLSAKIPTRDGYYFTEWNTEADGSGRAFNPGEVIQIGTSSNELVGTVVLYAIWEQDTGCPANKICYMGNGAKAGAMNNQDATSNANNILIPSNYSRPGYGFAGWSTTPDNTDATATVYGPNATINPGNLSSSGLKLYARWITPTGTLQTWVGASSLNTGDVIALKDNRDNEVYTVSKLADGNVWITENLRLVPNTANITEHNTNNPTSNFLAQYSSSASSNMCANDDDNTCDNSVQFNANNLDRSLTQDYSNNDKTSAWYSYGVMYNWYTATAGNGTYETTSGNVSGDLCPTGWHLPTGGSGGEWGILSSAISASVGGTGDIGLRTYPNNFIRSGDYNPQENGGGGTGRGLQGRIWSATASSATNAYRMGYNGTTVTATSNSWNKWDGFSIRCIYQGSNIPYVDIVVDFVGSNIDRVTFFNSEYGTQTATPTAPTVNLVKNSTYTITAVASTGYEFSSWSTTSGNVLTDPTANPTAYTATNDATLSASATLIPSYNVAINLGNHVRSIDFYNVEYGTITVENDNIDTSGNNTPADTDTISLRRGVTYTITATYDDGYSIGSWSTGLNGAIGNTTSPATTYIITGPSTLSLAAIETEEITYSLVYDAGTGTDAPDGDAKTSYNPSEDFIITNSAPIYYGYTFTGWSETPDTNNNGTTVDYVAGDTITVANVAETSTVIKTLYPVYTSNSCSADKICYYDNGADVNDGGRNTMSDQSVTSNTSATLVPSNYSKVGYGFAGWTTSANATPYGPNATITVPDVSSAGLALYAKWVKSEGDLQSWNGCSVMNEGDVTALTDIRDNSTYAVAKLADGNCWTIENLRIDPATANITASNTNNPTSKFVAESNPESGNSLSTTTMCSTNDSECFDQIQYNSNSTNRGLRPSYNTNNTNNSSWFSYGTYFNWYTATAGNGTYDFTATSGPDGDGNTGGDICPKNWRIPTGNTKGEFNALNTAINAGVTNNDANWRAYPNNFVWSGDYNGDKRTSAYSNGRLWSSTASSNNEAYRAGYKSNEMTVKNRYYNKWDGFSVRCIYAGTTAVNNNSNTSSPTAIEPTSASQSSITTESSTDVAAPVNPDSATGSITDSTISSDNLADSYVSPQGVTTGYSASTMDGTTQSSSSTPTIAIISVISASTGVALLLLTKRQEDQESDSETSQKHNQINSFILIIVEDQKHNK